MILGHICLLSLPFSASNANNDHSYYHNAINTRNKTVWHLMPITFHFWYTGIALLCRCASPQFCSHYFCFYHTENGWDFSIRG